MSVQALSSRAIIGEFFRTLNAADGSGWINLISNLFGSDQDSETYAWLGQVPQMREWLGGRNAKGFSDQNFTIRNKHYEATIDILVRWLRRDKTGQAMVRIRELALRSNSHWASLMSTLILNGPSTVCYDGQFFFDTDHSEGSSGTQDNDITVDISGLPAAAHGVVTAPSPEEMQQAILKGITQITGFKDDQGEPMNESASNFLVMVPQSLYFAGVNALTMPKGTGLSEQTSPGFSVNITANARLSSWTDAFPIFRTDSNAKSFIRQEETEVDLKVKAEGSEYEFDNDAHQYGIDAWRNVGYGMWQDACLVTLV